MMQMPEILFGRCIKFFLMAGDYGHDGALPPLPDIAWRLRINEEELESDLIELQKLGITSQDEGGWRITKWEDRQAPANSTERTHRWRERKRRAAYVRTGPGDVTFGDEERNESSHR